MHKLGCGPRGREGFGRGMWPMVAMMGGWGRRWGTEWGSEGAFGQGCGGPRGRGPGGRARVFGTGELRLVLLALVAEVPRHGYELIKAIEALTGGNYAPSPGVVYPTLNLLTDEGMIAEQAGDGARKAYAATDTGRAELDNRVEEFERLVARLRSMADDTERHGSPPIRRAIGNLLAALRSRATTGEFGRETMHQVADILDEAARKIERL